MNRLDGKPSSVQKNSDPKIFEKSIKFDSIESHQMTLNRPFGETEVGLSSSFSSIEYHLTIRITNSSLTPRSLSLILDVLNYQSVRFGINFNMMLAMYELYFRVLGQKRSSKEIKDNHIRMTVTVTEMILKVLKNTDLSLYPGNVYHLNSKLKSILSKGLMSKRTYGSRFKTWRPEKFLEVRIVPVDIQFLKRKKDTQPYSGYCKGYGESHPSAHKNKLKPSAEYDGVRVEFGQDEEQHLFNRCTDPIHLLTEYMLIRYYNEIETE